jgi:hypothetical protein
VSRLRLVLSGVAAAIGVLALLLAHDVRSWQHTVATATSEYGVAPKERLSLAASTVLPSRLSGNLIGVGRDRLWLDALQKFVVTRDKLANQDQLGPAAYRNLHDSEAALSKVTQDRNAARSSQAYDLLGILVFRSAYPGDSIDPGLIQDALTDLQTAVRVDGGNEDAKENLELVMRGLVAEHSVTIQAQGTGNHVTKIRKGGFGGPPGRGY